MKIVSVVNSKGGVGKSTVTRALASALIAKGYRTCILDIDSKQQSSCDWYKEAVRNGLGDDAPYVFVGRPSGVDAMLATIEKDHDFLFIDTPGSSLGGDASQALSSAIIKADLILIPINPSSSDEVNGTMKMDRDLLKTQSSFPEKKIRYLINRIKTRNTNWQTHSIEKFVENRLSLGFGIMESPLSDREQHLKTGDLGSTPMALSRRDPARQEIEQAAAEVLSLLGVEEKESSDA